MNLKNQVPLEIPHQDQIKAKVDQDLEDIDLKDKDLKDKDLKDKDMKDKDLKDKDLKNQVSDLGEQD